MNLESRLNRITPLAKRVYYLCDSPLICKTYDVSHYISPDNEIYINIFDGSCPDFLVKKILSRPQMSSKFTFYHELGHSFFYVYDVESNHDFRKLFKAKKEQNNPNILRSIFIDHDEDWVSLYGQQCPEEEFAETFAIVLSLNGDCKSYCKNRSPKIKKKINYVLDMINSSWTYYKKDYHFGLLFG